MLSPEEVSRIVAESNAEIATTALRDEPLGSDRHHRRYFLLGGYVEQIAQHPGILVVEVPQGPLFGTAGPSGLTQERLSTATLQWFDSLPAVDALLAWLNPKGGREGALRERVAAYRAALEEAVGSDGSLQASVVGMLTAPPAPAEDVVMEDAEENHAAEDTVMHDAAAADAAPAWSVPSLGDALTADKEAVLALLDSIPDDSYDLTKGAPQLLEAVRAGVTDAAAWDVLLAALVVVEEALLPGCFKPWWRLWAVTPTYFEENKGGPGPVRLRLAMLQSALRRPPAVQGGRATRGAAPERRETRTTRQVRCMSNKKMCPQIKKDTCCGVLQSAEPEEDEQEEEEEEEEEEASSDSELHRQREDADAALARRLQAEEEYGRGGRRGGSTRATRGTTGSVTGECDWGIQFYAWTICRTLMCYNMRCPDAHCGGVIAVTSCWSIWCLRVGAACSGRGGTWTSAWSCSGCALPRARLGGRVRQRGRLRAGGNHEGPAAFWTSPGVNNTPDMTCRRHRG